MKRLLTCLMLSCAALPAIAAPSCAPSITVILSLDRWGEVEHEMRVLPDKSGQDVQWVIWLNDQTGSWTLTGTQGAVTCIFLAERDGYKGQTIGDFVIGPAL